MDGFSHKTVRFVVFSRAAALAIAILALTMIGGKMASAAERVALIIGNSAYQKTAELKNPRNDAEAIAKLLTQFGFLVLKGIDVDQFNFKTLVRAFTREMKEAKLALFFYAGHGLQVGRRNFLLPVDAELKEEVDLDFETVELGFILQQMERKRRTNIILMDACRDNPFAVNLARNMGTRSSAIGRGLAALETGVGTFVGFATQPGNVALDGNQTNSPFTTAILNHLAVPGLDIGVLMRRVREDVIAATDGKQVPWSNSSLVGDSVVLNQTQRQIAVEPKISKKPAGSTSSNSAEVALELSYWNTIKNTTNPALFRSYLEKYPDGTFAGLAKAMIAALESNTPSPPVKEPKKQQVAAVDPDPSAATQEAEKPANNYSISHDLQAELRRLGCIAARPDGIWGPKSRRALKRYGKYAGLSLGSFEPTDSLLEEMRTRTKRVCPIQCGARYNLKNGKCVRKTCARNQILTRKGKCIAQRKTTKKRHRRQPEVVVEEFVEPSPRKRKKKNMFDNEGELCPRCNSL